MDVLRTLTSGRCENTVCYGQWTGIYHLDVGIHSERTVMFDFSFIGSEESYSPFLPYVAVIGQTPSNHPI
jgi:hypothetical protein